MAADEAGSAFVNILPNFAGFGKQMSAGIAAPLVGAGAAAGVLLSKLESIPHSMGVAGKAVDAFTDGALRNISSLGHTIHTKLALAAETAFAGTGVRMAADLERGLREVNTLFDNTGAASEASFGKVSEDVRQLSNELGIAQTTLTEGLYEALSAGVPPENAIDFVRVATKAAIGGVTDTKTAVDGLSTAINAFGLDTTDVERVADSFFATVVGGKTTFEQLALNFADVAPIAAAAGVKFEEVNASIATLTATGVRTAEATTQIRAAIQGLSRPSEDMDAIFQRLGHTNAEAALRSEGLAFALKVVRDASGGSQGALMELLGSIEAVTATQILAGEGADIFTKEMDRQNNAAGGSAQAFDEMEKSQARSFERLRTSMQNFAIVVGESLGPVIRALTSIVETMTDAFMALPKPLQQAVGGLIFLGTALGPPIFMLWRLHVAWKAVTAIMAAARVGSAVGGISAMGNALKIAGKNTLSFKAAWVGMKGLGMAQTAAGAMHLGGAFTALRGSMALLAGPAGIIAAGVVAFGLLDSAMSDVEDRIKGLKDLADEDLLTEFFSVAEDQAGDFGSSLKNFGLTMVMLGESRFADKESTAQLDLFNRVIKDGNLALAQRILTMAKGLPIEGALRDAFDAAVASAKQMNVDAATSAGILGDVDAAAGGAADGIVELTDAQKAFESALASSMSMAGLYKEELARINQGATEGAKKTADAIRDAARSRLDAVTGALNAEKDALDDVQRAELDVLENTRITGEASRRRHEEAEKAMRQRHEAEREALDERAEAETKATEATVKAEELRAEAVEKAAERTTLTAAETKAAALQRIADTKDLFGDLAVISAKGGGAIVDDLLAMGPEAADMIDELAGQSKPELADFVRVMEAGSADAVSEMREQFEEIPDAMATIGQRAGTKFHDGLLDALRAGKITIDDILAEAAVPTPVPVGFIGPLTQSQLDFVGPLRSATSHQYGGTFRPGELMRVGEAGEELVQFGTGGTVIPNHELIGGRSAGDMTLVFNEKVDPLHVARQVAWTLPR